MPGPKFQCPKRRLKDAHKLGANESIWRDASVAVDNLCAPANFPFSTARFVLQGVYFKEPHDKTDLNMFISRGSDGAENMLGSHRNLVWIRCYLGPCNCTYSDCTLNKSPSMNPSFDWALVPKNLPWSVFFSGLLIASINREQFSINFQTKLLIKKSRCWGTISRRCSRGCFEVLGLPAGWFLFFLRGLSKYCVFVREKDLFTICTGLIIWDGLDSSSWSRFCLI